MKRVEIGRENISSVKVGVHRQNWKIFFEKIRFLPLSYLNIDAVNQRNWSLYIKLRLEYFVIVK